MRPGCSGGRGSSRCICCLAFARWGPVSDLLGDAGVTAGDIYAAVVAGEGRGDELVLGRLPRAPRAETVLQRAVAMAVKRGERRPDGVHVLLALAGDDRVQAILRDLGVDDLPRLVDEHYPPAGPALSHEQVRAELVSAALTPDRRPLRAPVPAFERFTADARRMIRVAAETAARLEHREVDPFHLLIACVQVPELRRAGARSALARR